MEGVNPKSLTPIHKNIKLCKHKDCLMKTYNITSKEEEKFILKMTKGRGTSLCTDFLLNVRRDFRKQLMKKKKEYDQNQQSRISKKSTKSKDISKPSRGQQPNGQNHLPTPAKNKARNRNPMYLVQLDSSNSSKESSSSSTSSSSSSSSPTSKSR